MASIAEHRVEMAADSTAGKAAAAALPEKWLNRFVHFVATMERLGNALGTLAFTWATVVLLGGYPTELDSDFYLATAIIFLEAVREEPAIRLGGGIIVLEGAKWPRNPKYKPD